MRNKRIIIIIIIIIILKKKKNKNVAGYLYSRLPDAVTFQVKGSTPVANFRRIMCSIN